MTLNELPLDRPGTVSRRLLRETDWNVTELGRLEGWSAELGAAIRLVQAASVPMCLFVGPEARLVYNDAYIPIAGARHPLCFGMPLGEGWPEVADFNGDILRRVRKGEAPVFRDQRLELFRNGRAETVFLDLQYSPVTDRHGAVVAVLALVSETTGKMLAQQALRYNEERLTLAVEGAGIIGTWDWDVESDVVTADRRFAELYHVDPAEAALGVPIDRFFAAIHPEDRERLGDAIATALDRHAPLRTEYRIVRPDGSIVWLLALGRVSGGEKGEPLRLPGLAIDISEQHRAQQALAESESKFRAIADTMPQMVWSTTPDGLHDYYNARWYEFTGVPVGSTDGEGWNDMFHPDDQERAWQVWQHSLETGAPYEIEYRLRHHSGEYRWTLGRALPIRDDEGRITRWFGTCTDIHETKIAAEEREIIAQELSHRIKNIFSVLGSIISLSARVHPEAGPYAQELRSRILALGTAHDFVHPERRKLQPEGRSSLHGLLRTLLAVYDDDARRLTIEGPDTSIDDGAATPLALIFHELGTNAAKYGALKDEGGRVVISCRGEGETFGITWKEHVTGRVSPSTPGTGFGARLIELSVKGQMAGEIERHWESDGLRVEMALPVWALNRPAKLKHPQTDLPAPDQQS